MFRLAGLSIALALHVACCTARADIAEQVRLDLFYTPGCAECERFKRNVYPDFQDQFEGFYDLIWHDMTQSETIPLLIAYQQRCRNTENGKISIVVDHTDFLSGYPSIATGLFARVNEGLVRRQSPGWSPPAPPDAETLRKAAQTRFNALTFSVVAFGGLIDGFNPCAISTLIFFMSVLAVAKATRRTRLLVGISFIAASFTVYICLGLGFIFAFRRAPNFTLVKTVVEIGLGLCMIPLAALSFRDAFRFRKTQRPDDVTLQIPKRIKARIHTFMNARLGVGGPIVGGFVTGAGVTVLESVCTGQGYLPTLMYVLKQNCTDLCAWILLITYNLLFVLPLAVVFVCFHRGMQLKALIAWSRRNLVVTKILLGIFFTAMAVLLLWRTGAHAPTPSSENAPSAQTP